MKFLNFGKIKKTWQSIKNFFAPKDKKAFAETDFTTTQKEQYEAGRQKRGLSGYRHYTHILFPVNNKKASVVYTSFNKQILPGFKMFIGKVLYAANPNPLYGN